MLAQRHIPAHRLHSHSGTALAARAAQAPTRAVGTALHRLAEAVLDVAAERAHIVVVARIPDRLQVQIAADRFALERRAVDEVPAKTRIARCGVYPHRAHRAGAELQIAAHGLRLDLARSAL